MAVLWVWFFGAMVLKSDVTVAGESGVFQGKVLLGGQSYRAVSPLVKFDNTRFRNCSKESTETYLT